MNKLLELVQEKNIVPIILKYKNELEVHEKKQKLLKELKNIKIKHIYYKSSLKILYTIIDFRNFYKQKKHIDRSLYFRHGNKYKFPYDIILYEYDTELEFSNPDQTSITTRFYKVEKNQDIVSPKYYKENISNIFNFEIEGGYCNFFCFFDYAKYNSIGYELDIDKLVFKIN